MPDDKLDAFPPNEDGVDRLARELGQDTPLISHAPLDDPPSRPTVRGNLIVAGAVAIGVAVAVLARLGVKP